MHQTPNGRELRKGRFSEAGRIYLVTAVTHDRRSVFRRLEAARHLIICLKQEQDAGRADTLAFVVMPDHLHWLLQLRGAANLSKTVGGVKGVAAHGLGGRLWQAGFHDHALRKDEDVAAVARYVVANPVRAGSECWQAS